MQTIETIGFIVQEQHRGKKKPPNCMPFSLKSKVLGSLHDTITGYYVYFRSWLLVFHPSEVFMHGIVLIGHKKEGSHGILLKIIPFQAKFFIHC